MSKKAIEVIALIILRLKSECFEEQTYLQVFYYLPLSGAAGHCAGGQPSEDFSSRLSKGGNAVGLCRVHTTVPRPIVPRHGEGRWEGLNPQLARVHIEGALLSALRLLHVMSTNKHPATLCSLALRGKQVNFAGHLALIQLLLW